MYASKEYAALLEEIARSEPRIRAVLLTDLAGVLRQVVERTSTTTPSSQTDQLHAFLGCAIAQSVVEMGSKHSLAPLHTVIVGYQRGTLILAPTGSGVLIVLADPHANLGLIRYKLTTVAKRLHQLESTLDPASRQAPALVDLPRDRDGTPPLRPKPAKKSVRSEEPEEPSEKDSLLHALEALESI